MGDEDYGREDREYWTVKYDVGDIVFSWDDDEDLEEGDEEDGCE